MTVCGSDAQCDDLHLRVEIDVTRLSRWNHISRHGRPTNPCAGSAPEFENQLPRFREDINPLLSLFPFPLIPLTSFTLKNRNTQQASLMCLPSSKTPPWQTCAEIVIAYLLSRTKNTRTLYMNFPRNKKKVGWIGVQTIRSVYMRGDR